MIGSVRLEVRRRLMEASGPGMHHPVQGGRRRIPLNPDDSVTAYAFYATVVGAGSGRGQQTARIEIEHDFTSHGRDRNQRFRQSGLPSPQLQPDVEPQPSQT